MENNTFMTIVEILLAILVIIAYWKIFEKIGEKGWKSLIPFYSAYIQFKYFWGNGWMFLLLLIPIVDVVVYVMYSIKFGKAFGKSTGFIVGLILLPSIFSLLIGFDENAKYLGINGENAPAEESKENA